MRRGSETRVAAAFAALMLGWTGVGCGKAARQLEEARALEASGKLFEALAAYEDIEEAHPHGRYGDEARDAAMDVRVAIGAGVVEDAATLFELPKQCSVVDVARVEPAEGGAWVELALTCEGRETRAAGRVLGPDRVWDLTPITGVLQTEGECVFRSHGNPLGEDWSLPVDAEECWTQRNLRQSTIDRLGGGSGEASFECDCRLGEAEFEFPRGDPAWRRPAGPLMSGGGSPGAGMPPLPQ